MKKTIDDQQKLDDYCRRTAYSALPEAKQTFLREIASSYRFTFQEFRQFVEALRDLDMWGEDGYSRWWEAAERQIQVRGQERKTLLLRAFQQKIDQLRQSATIYPAVALRRSKKREKSKIVTVKSDKSIWGRCPVASERTVCCNLRTIDAVENCAFGCSYCTIQTFYSQQVTFDADLSEKLATIPLDPDRRYHFGTGQSSDSLVWGNRNGNLDALCGFASSHPNVLLEFKTKSNNIRYFLDSTTPPNIVCSWSLNTQTIIENEEHFTASLDERIEAARTVAGQGIKVAFHFHPMIYYNNWEIDYPAIAARLISSFLPEEVLFISFGSVTFIKPVIKKIRDLGHQTKVLQMPMVSDPHGKLTYPDDLKVEMFRKMYAAFSPWHGRVFTYLCMEKATIWEQVLGFAYPSNAAFEASFAADTFAKVYPAGSSPPAPGAPQARPMASNG